MARSPLTKRRKSGPAIKIPPFVPPTPEEIARQEALSKEAERLRLAIGDIGIGAAALIRQIRDATSGDLPDDEAGG